MSSKKWVVSAAVIGAAALTLTGCSGGGGGDSDGGDGVTITWWHNGNNDPLLGFWQQVADEFEEANPGVTVDVQAYQNEDLQRTLIPNALRSGDAPDLFSQWGGGELAAQVDAGYLRDLSGDVQDEVDRIGPTVGAWQDDGATYGLPYRFGIEGFWYNKDLFAAAGIDAPPTTLDELNDAVVSLREADITPIAVGAGDKWPAAHYWYNFALKSCSPEVLEQSATDLSFDDPCFEDAGAQLQEFLATNPFQDGFLATPAQQGAGSSAGLVANGGAAMELMGDWDPSVMSGLTPDGTVPPFLGWFNFPSIAGSQGDASAVLGGGDGFSVSADAPDETIDLLKYVMTDDVQSRLAAEVGFIPTVPAASSSVTDPNLLQVQSGLQAADYVQIWLDTAYGPNVGGAMNDSIVNLFAGQASPSDIVSAMQSAADSQ